MTSYDVISVVTFTQAFQNGCMTYLESGEVSIDWYCREEGKEGGDKRENRGRGREGRIGGE